MFLCFHNRSNWHRNSTSLPLGTAWPPCRWVFVKHSQLQFHVIYNTTIATKYSFKGTVSVFSQVYSLYYALPEERENDCNVFDLIVKMEKQLDGRIHHVFICIYVFSEYICSQRPHLLVTFNIVLSSLFPVSHPGAIESYLFTIET